MGELTVTQIAAFVATFGPWPAAFILLLIGLDKRWVVLGWQYREQGERFDKLSDKLDAISTKLDNALNRQSEGFDLAINQFERVRQLTRGDATGRGQ